ncbi:MAG TPA: PQQ-binding-like beta-propeller repeat protein [Kofleriaceae bacterium]|nr:PQQ-binding-like beta-propeller repeat protein [Kofleriaceae bacterium]
MRVIQVKCSHCAAVLKVEPDRDFIDCEYCGTRSTVQRRTRVFQLPRPVKVATVATTAPPRVALQVVNKVRVLVSLLSTLITFAFIGGIFWFVNKQVEKATGTSVVGHIKKGVAGPSSTTWLGHGPALLARVDGDRILDPVGRVRTVGQGDTCHLAAFSGATGERLWQSEALGSYSDTYQGRVIQLEKMFLFADPRGHLTAFRASDGGKLWSVGLADKVERACRLGAADVAVQTADRSWQAVATATGAARASKGPQSCLRLPDDDEKTGDPELTVMTPGSLRLPGMSVARVIQRGRGAPVAVATRQPGTAVPMLARLDRSKAVWKAEVPAENPLAARSSELASVTDSQACAIYETDSSPHLTCFDLKSGIRRWDTEIAKGTTIVMRSLVWRDGRFYLSSWGHLQVLEGATGRRIHLIGAL